MLNINLKPCPFCGGKATLCKPYITMTPVYWVKCEACECESSTFKTKEEAEKAWNRRKDGLI